MRLSNEALIDRALLTLEEALAARRLGPVPATFGLRLAIAYLYAVSNDDLGYHARPGDVFREFWDELMEEVPNPRGEGAEKINRGIAYSALASFNGICRRVGRTGAPSWSRIQEQERAARKR